MSKYCLSNNGAVARKQQSSCFFPPSLCRTKHQAPQESTLLFCCCITELSSGHRRQWPQPPLRGKQFKSRAGFIQFNLMCQASLLQAFLQCLLLTLRKEHVSNLARTWGGAEDNLGSNFNLLWQKLQFSVPICRLSKKILLHAVILIFPSIFQIGFKNNSVCQWQSSLCHFSVSLNVTSKERKKIPLQTRNLWSN